MTTLRERLESHLKDKLWDFDNHVEHGAYRSGFTACLDLLLPVVQEVADSGHITPRMRDTLTELERKLEAR